MNDSLGHRIRLARKAAGLSQEDVAKLGGPARPTLSRLERGAGQAPERFTIESLVKVLRVRHEWLVFGTGDMHQESVKEDLASYLPSALDSELLGMVIETVAQGLEAKKVKLPPKVLATLIVSIYEAALQEKGMREELSSRIQPFIRLALAGAG